jgi:hypothetical protein
MTGERTIAIGDIHGCSAALAALVRAIDPTALDTLAFLGDSSTGACWFPLVANIKTVSDLVSDFFDNAPCLAKPPSPKLLGRQGFCARQVSRRLSPLGGSPQELRVFPKLLSFQGLAS